MTTFLYVEDDYLSREIMELVLMRGLGYSDVFMFEDSSDFMRRVTALTPRPDVIFLDIHVEPIDGFEMLRLLRKSRVFDPVPIIAMTASVMNEEVQQLKEAGFDGAVGKPIDIDTFPEIVSLILHGQEVWHVT
jgi:two-component system cell cycle response regulator DivK